MKAKILFYLALFVLAGCVSEQQEPPAGYGDGSRYDLVPPPATGLSPVDMQEMYTSPVLFPSVA